MKHTPVLIVGAGPVGLSLACELKQHGTDCMIIDNRPSEHKTTTAFYLQPATLQIYARMGIAEKLISKGIQLGEIHTHLHKGRTKKIELTHLQTPYPYLLSITHQKLERNLETHLKSLSLDVKRPYTLIHAKQLNDNTVEATLKNQHSEYETVTTNWLIICDGSNKEIRESLDAAFISNELPKHFMLANIDWPNAKSKKYFSIYYDKQHFLSICPLRHNTAFVIATLCEDDISSPDKRTLIKQDVAQLIQQRSNKPCEVKQINEFSNYWGNCKIINTMQEESIIFIGDAAHNTPPIGAQNINCGIQDAHNLAWKLSLIVDNKIDKKIIVSYPAERYPITQQIIDETHCHTLPPSQSWLAKCKNILLSMLPHHQGCKDSLHFFSQLPCDYSDSPIIDYRLANNKKAPKPGSQFQVSITHDQQLSHHLRHNLHTVIIFSGKRTDDNNEKNLRTIVEWLRNYYSTTCRALIITGKRLDFPATTAQVIDPQLKIHKKYAIHESLLYVIRPDKYIAFCDDTPSLKTLTHFLSQYTLTKDGDLASNNPPFTAVPKETQKSFFDGSIDKGHYFTNKSTKRKRKIPFSIENKIKLGKEKESVDK